MIKKVNDINLVPTDLQELLLPEKGEMVPIGRNVFEMFPFPVEQYLKLLSFLSKYFNAYNDTFAEDKNIKQNQFFGALANSLLEHNILSEFFSLFPDIEEDSKEITFEQLQYLLGIIYKLNFFSKKKPIQNLQTKAAMERMQDMMGLSFMNQVKS